MLSIFHFALDDWERLPIGGQYEYYVRPDRPYTIIIDNEHNQVALTLSKSLNTNWYHEEFIRQLESAETLSLNQQNIYFLEKEALLTEESLGINHNHFYVDQESLSEKSYMYTAIFEITLFNGSVCFLGVRNQQEYLLIYNAIPFLKYEENSFEYQKAVIVITSLTGYLTKSVAEVSTGL